MRVVVDANVIISGIFWKGPPEKILRRWLGGELILLISGPILAEYRDILQRFTKDHGFSIFAKWNRYLTEFSEMVEPRHLGGICRDPDDEMYLEAAVGGKAKALISGDKDLLAVGKIHEIPILTPKAFQNLN